MDERSRCW